MSQKQEPVFTREQQDYFSGLAERAIKAAQDKLVANMRFLDPAVFALRIREADEPDAKLKGIRTNGTEIVYTPLDVLFRARKGLSQLTHDYMHILLHCIFQHFSVHGKVRADEWSLAVDIAVEDVIDSFDMDCFETSKTARRREELAMYRRNIGNLTAEKVYRYILDSVMTEGRFEMLCSLFMVDNHELWYSSHLPEKHGNTAEDGEESDDAGAGDRERRTDGEQESHDRMRMSTGAELETEQDWKKIAQLVKTAIEAGGGLDENGPGRMLANIRALGPHTMNYSTFLKRFASHHEALIVDDSSYDYIFYTYGLKLYGDMPLIEPLEYSDERRIRDLVIVIDSSASTKGPLVESFVQRTFDILMNSEEFKSKFNVRLIQCDADIQADVELKSMEDVEHYLETIKIKGFGGTDFRTAFNYVDKLVLEGAFTDLKGLIYFTDGRGTFPKQKPAYDAAFVFVDEDKADAVKVPPWAIKVVFDSQIN